VPDILVICVLIAIGLYFLGSNTSGTPGGRTVTIRTLAGESSTYDLDTDRTIEVTGTIGTTSVTIENRSVRFASSCCPHGLCVKKGPISRSGDWIACLPNGVIARVHGEAAYDGITP
jgi:hypothetical protein